MRKIGAMRFTRAELEAFRNREVEDLIGPDVKLLFVGINPGLWTAAVRTHFAHPANRFYPALLRAGIIERAIDPAPGMSDEDRAHLISRGVGITNLRGLNAHETIATLATAYSAPAAEAGVIES